MRIFLFGLFVDSVYTETVLVSSRRNDRMILNLKLEKNMTEIRRGLLAVCHYQNIFPDNKRIPRTT